MNKYLNSVYPHFCWLKWGRFRLFILAGTVDTITNHGAYHAESAPMFWDLRAKGLEEQALLPIATLEEMRGALWSF